MPELPEVQTTMNGLQRHIIGLTIKDVWTSYDSPYFKGSETIKDPVYFKHFKKEVSGKKVISVERRAKNILINLNDSAVNLRGNKTNTINAPETTNKTILIHMKMTGHLLYGHYKFKAKNKIGGKTINSKDPWEPIEPSSLKDPRNRHIRFVITFSNGKQLALSDMRKFAKVTTVDSKTMHESEHLNNLGPEPLDKSFNFHEFDKRLGLRPSGKIKQVLMDQKIISGIGNIYADESLWHASIHPLEKVQNVKTPKRKILFSTIKKILIRSIDFGGDSMSDYRNISGEKGKFQEQHHAYQKTGERCDKHRCSGTIVRITLGGRGTHFCNVHQQLMVK